MGISTRAAIITNICVILADAGAHLTGVIPAEWQPLLLGVVAVLNAIAFALRKKPAPPDTPKESETSHA